MSAYPLTLEGTSVSALVVGGGPVGTRKALALLEAGARVRVVAPEVSTELELVATENERLVLERSAYTAEDIGDATVVVAATNDPGLNASIAIDARAKARLVNVADSPDRGNCSMPAVLRSGDITVAVNAGGVPTAARRIRDAIAARVDDRYAAAIAALAGLRHTLLGAGRRERWTEAADALIGRDFCEQVESGRFAASVERWR